MLPNVIVGITASELEVRVLESFSECMVLDTKTVGVVVSYVTAPLVVVVDCSSV